MKVLLSNLMKEQLWDQQPSVVEMFTFKKHFKELPGMQDKSIIELKKNKYE